MRRRFIVEVEVADSEKPSSMLDAILAVSGTLQKLKEESAVIDYGVGLEHDFTWFVKTAAQIDKDLLEAGQ